jgi:hypothetical protein
MTAGSRSFLPFTRFRQTGQVFALVSHCYGRTRVKVCSSTQGTRRGNLPLGNPDGTSGRSQLFSRVRHQPDTEDPDRSAVGIVYDVSSYSHHPNKRDTVHHSPERPIPYTFRMGDSQ